MSSLRLASVLRRSPIRPRLSHGIRFMSATPPEKPAATKPIPKADQRAGALTKFYMRILGTTIDDGDVKRLAAQAMSIGTYGFAGATALGTIGVDTAPIMAGLGATGFTLGFALKDAASNAFAGVSLVVQRPFKAGDTVRVGPDGAYHGKVSAIDYRYVHLLLQDGTKARISIPSSLVYDNPVILEPQQPAKGAVKK